MNEAPKKIKVYSQTLIDPDSEFHLAWHKSINEITEIHTHDFFEIFLIASGRVYHIVKSRKIILEKGDLVLIRPDDIHSYEKLNSINCELINLAFPRGTVNSLSDYLGKGFELSALLESQFPPAVRLSKLELDILINRFEELQLVDRDDHSVVSTHLRILLLDLFIKYFSKKNKNADSRFPKWIVITVEEMSKKENFVAGFETMQKISGKSKEHLCRELKKYFNVTPTTYINNLRLNYAANLLSNTDEKIAFISLEAGFENLSHFYHVFRKRFGHSPGVFRKTHLKNFIP